MSALILLVCVASMVIAFVRVCVKHSLSDLLNQMFIIVVPGQRPLMVAVGSLP